MDNPSGSRKSGVFFGARKRPGGFTLVELLVTLGVVLVLSALLLPGMKTAFGKGKDTQCLSNLRQLGVAVNLYIGENNGELPFEGVEENPTWTQTRSPQNERAWFNVLPPYVEHLALSELANSTAARRQFTTAKASSILQCPRAIWQGNEATATGPRFSYAFNSKIGSGRIAQIADGLGANSGNRPVAPSTVPMILDARASAKEPKAVSGMNNDVGTARAYTRRINNRHGAAHTVNGLAHIVFFDGSVRSFKASELLNASGYNIVTSPVIWNPWNPDEQ